MLLPPILAFVEDNFIEVLSPVQLPQRDGHPSNSGWCFRLDAIVEPPRVLYVVVVDELVGEADLFEQSHPWKIHRL